MSLLKPDEYYKKVEDIDAEKLVKQGIACVLIDIDNTLVPRDTKVLSCEVKSWIASLKTAGLQVCLLSNNWHKTVLGYADELDLPIVYKAMKPAPFAYFCALGKLKHMQTAAIDVSQSQVVMIGDQILTDVLGAHLCRFNAILVEPQATKDLWYTLILRKFETRILRNMQPKA